MARKKHKGPREPNGRLSRKKADKPEHEKVMFEQGAPQTVLQARRRHRNAFAEPADCAKWREQDAAPVTKAQAAALKLDLRGSILGIMEAKGIITAAERTAGEDYCERYTTYAALNGLPRPTPQGPSYGAVRGGTRPDRLKSAAAAKVAHFEDQRILTHCSAGVVPAMKRACVTDEAAPEYQIIEGLRALIANGR